MSRSVAFLVSAAALVAAGCSPSYSPNTYATTAVQQVNKVESGIVVGYRQVMISASGTVGAVTGGAAGGILGTQSSLVGVNSALGAVGGTAIGTVVGTTIEHASADTTGWEYIVRKTNGELLSVTQREETPLPLGQKVLVIAGNQARVIPDYSVPPDPVAATTAKTEDKPQPAAQPEKPAKKTTKSSSRMTVPSSSPLLVVPVPMDDSAPARVAAPETRTAPASTDTAATAPSEPAAATAEPAANEPAASEPAAAPAEAAPADTAPAAEAAPQSDITEGANTADASHADEPAQAETAAPTETQ